MSPHRNGSALSSEHGIARGSLDMNGFHDAHAAEASERFGPYKRMHRLLRGRYRYFLPVLLLAVVAGAFKGWRSQSPQYRSEGLLHVAYSLPKVINDTDQNEPMQMYEEFLQSEILLMGSRHVLATALADPAFQAALKNGPKMDVESFSQRLTIEHPPRTQTISVAFLASDPVVASSGVKAVISAFLSSYGSSDTQDGERRLDVLTARKETLTKQISQLRTEMATVRPPTATSIAMVDDLMREMFKEQAALETQLNSLEAAGYGESRPAFVSVKQRLTTLQDKIERYRKEFTDMQIGTVFGAPRERRVAIVPEFLPYEDRVDELRGELEETARRIDILHTEASLGAERFRVLSNGDVPAAPYSDRRARMAMIYGVGAGAVPLTLFLLLGLWNPTFRHSEDAQDAGQSVPLLGVLPTLPDRNSHPDLSKIAAYCVHNLRVRLELIARNNKRGVFMITSAAAGEGKTSLTLALGISFSAAGKRTLLIDSDLVGQGLTHRLDREGEMGLIESIDKGMLVPLPTIGARLSLMPVGRVGKVRGECGFTVEEISEVVEAAKANFDIIILDTGPALATLQTPIVAQIADHIIMTISQGQQQAMVQRSLKMLRSVGIRVTGFVFNRAQTGDYRRWIGGASYYATSSEVARARTRARRDPNAPFGPLASSLSPGLPALLDSSEQ